MITLMSYIYWIIESKKVEKMIAGEGTFEETIRRLMEVNQRLVEIKPDFERLILIDVVLCLIMIMIIAICCKIIEDLKSSSEEKR